MLQSTERLAFKYDRGSLMDPSETVALHASMASERELDRQQRLRMQ